MLLDEGHLFFTMPFRVLIVPGVITAFSAVVIWAALQLELSPPMIVGHSMQPRALLEVKKVIRETDIGAVRKAMDNWRIGEVHADYSNLVQYLDHSQLNH